ncbi:hypothetical protein BAUCODRAFT_444485 [Baudoinia panamericana UAMH 10762]|uniref:Uncharacterized protein n=1 Tax=Baudoinia panamericana (strain UAMH 10762) TaxID=717646 RepID=M2NE56_BAUPA|nr:uncharacterized protein BAUCODRAFT_444485 [Baudoinia panamericana UAMH 10762]EMC97230.1 hypothetical protein BAUCODRAFT_444485 [Baudoinia panamericana UAMH 10762]
MHEVADEVPEEGEVQPDAPSLIKVHVRGLETFSSQDVKNFAHDFYASELLRHVQWVDDTSANIVYETEIAAAEALQALSAEEVADPMQLRPAKRLATHPDAELYVRQAKESDVKIKNAHVYSTYYLRNADDPENPHGNFRGKRRFNERGYRSRDYSFKRQRRERGDEEGDSGRRGSKDEPFDVNLYDDDPVSVAARDERRGSKNSHSGSDQNGRKQLRFEEELFTAKQNGRLRNRSASPMRDGDGRFGFEENQPRRRTARPRSPTPPRIRAGRDNRAARDDLRKELFPGKAPSSGYSTTNGYPNGSNDLFPHRSSPPKGPRELFPSHKRQDARDIDSEFRKVTTDIDSRPKREPDDKPRDLFARISGGPKAKNSYGRLQDGMEQDAEPSFSFKGAGKAENGGFSIRGASREKSASSQVKELFPIKSGGDGGRDLFDGRIKGRGSQRQRAEDLF